MEATLVKFLGKTYYPRLDHVDVVRVAAEVLLGLVVELNTHFPRENVSRILAQYFKFKVEVEL